MDCRARCGACCTVLLIDEPFDGYPDGKPAGEPCRHLTAELACGIYPRRPASCRAFEPAVTLCGDTRDEAFELLELTRAILDGDTPALLLERARGLSS